MSSHSTGGMWSLLLIAALLGLEPQINIAYPTPLFTGISYGSTGPIGYRKIPSFPSPYFTGPSFNRWNFIPRRPSFVPLPFGYTGAFIPRPGYLPGVVRRVPVSVNWGQYAVRPVNNRFVVNNAPYNTVAAHSPTPVVIPKKIEFGRHVSPFENGNILSKVNPYPNFKTMNSVPMRNTKIHAVAKAKSFNSLIQ